MTKKISQLSSATPTTASLFEFEDASGISKYATGAQMAALVSTNRAFSNTLVNSSTSAQIPFDSTIPQVGEGTEILTVTITPSTTTARIRVECVVKFSITPVNWAAAAMFINGGANAVEFSTMYCETNGGGGNLYLVHEYVPGSTSAQTISVRAGVAGSSITLTLNAVGSATFGGVMKSSLLAREV